MIVKGMSDVAELRAGIRHAAEATVAALRKAIVDQDPLTVLREMKFRQVGFDPLQGGRSLNVIEQLNQTFTYVVNIAAVDFLLRKYPESVPFRLNLGARRGPDIQSLGQGAPMVAAETFAAVDARNNRKLRKDIERMTSMRGIDHRYVFYYSEVRHEHEKRVNGVHICWMDIDAWLRADAGTGAPPVQRGV